jgi:hypothetical protein
LNTKALKENSFEGHSTALRSLDHARGECARPMRWITVFIPQASTILAFTGAAKVLTAFSNAKVLEAQDPVFGFSLRHLLVLVGIAELVVSVICLVNRRNRRLSLLLLAWFASSVVAYRIGLWTMDWQGPCRCLGTLADVLPVSPKTVDLLMKMLLAYLLLGSCAGLLRLTSLNALENQSLPKDTRV